MTLAVARIVGAKLTPEQLAVVEEGIAKRLGVKEYRVDGEYLTFSRANILRNAVVSLDQESGLPINKTVHVTEPHFNPTTIGYYGLECLSKYIATKDTSYLDAARRVAQYALRTISKSGAWPSPYQHHWFKGRSGDPMPTGWPSALSQGYLLSFLARLHVIEPNAHYLDACRQALRPFTKTVEEGGVLRLLSPDLVGHVGPRTAPRKQAVELAKSILRPLVWRYYGSETPLLERRLPFYEEYPTPIPSLVLNGFMFALFGLYDFWKVSGDRQAHRLYAAGEKTLERLLPFYDLGFNTAYDLTHLQPSNWQTPPNACRQGYHQTHLIELSAMNCIENNKYIHVYYRWLLYERGIAITGN